jgi:hypothetical protein
MSQLQPQENAIGLPIVYRVDSGQFDINGDPVPRDISGTTTHELVFRKPPPDKSLMVKPATFVTDGNDGLLTITTIDGDLVPHGTFEVQAYLVKGAVQQYTEVSLFHVNANA